MLQRLESQANTTQGRGPDPHSVFEDISTKVSEEEPKFLSHNHDFIDLVCSELTAKVKRRYESSSPINASP